MITIEEALEKARDTKAMEFGVGCMAKVPDMFKKLFPGKLAIIRPQLSLMYYIPFFYRKPVVICITFIRQYTYFLIFQLHCALSLLLCLYELVVMLIQSYISI